MPGITIHHNPKCGTSRNALAVIRHSGVDPEVIEDLRTPPAILINRPIVVTSLGTQLCRPSEAVVEIPPVQKLAGFTKEDGKSVVDNGARCA